MYGGASSRALSPRRQRLQPYLVGVVVLVVVAGVAARAYGSDPELLSRAIDSAPRVGAALNGPMPDALLPAPADRNYPPPGVEEAGAPLGVPPVVSVPSTRYTFTATQESATGGTVPVAWSPCRPIHYVVNSAGAPSGFVDQVAVAIADLSAATGLRFIADGPTAEVPAETRRSFQPELYGDRWAPVLIAIGDESSVPTLRGAIVGIGGFASSQVMMTGVRVAITGEVFLDRDVLTRPRNAATPAYVPVLRHELAHLVGLNHVNDPTQLMNPTTGAVTTYQDGDRAGLARLGAGACTDGV